MHARNKYGAIRTEVDGKVFASKAEARRYGELKLLQQAGEISGLECQVRIPLHAYGSGQVVGHYLADFRYLEHGKGIVVEDVKSPATADNPLYRWKKKHVAAEYGVAIRETGKGVG